MVLFKDPELKLCVQVLTFDLLPLHQARNQVSHVFEIHTNLLHVLEVVELLPEERVPSPLIINQRVKYLKSMSLLLLLIIELLLLRPHILFQERLLLQILHVSSQHHIHALQFSQDIVSLTTEAIANSLAEWAHPIVLNRSLANVVLVALLQTLTTVLSAADQFSI